MFVPGFIRLTVISLFSIAVSLIAFGFISSSASSADDQVINSLGEVDSVRFLSLPANDIIFNPSDSKLYASVPSTAGSIGNTITPVDPYAGTIGTSVFIGSEPAKFALRNDGQTLYTYLGGAYSVARYNTATQAAGGNFLVGAYSFYGLLAATDLAVSPDDPNIVAVARQALGVSPPQRGVALYYNGTRLPQTGPDHSEGSDFLAFGDTGATLYGTGQYSGLKRYSVTGGGVTLAQSTSLAAGSPIKYAAGTIYSGGGHVVNPATMTLLGTFPGVAGSGTAFVPEPSVGRVYFISPAGSPSTSWILKAFDVNTFTQVGSLTITNVAGTPTSLVRWGTNGLAFRTTGGQIVLIQTSLIPTPNPIPFPSSTPTVTPTPTPTPWDASIRQIAMTANDMAYSQTRQKLYVTIPSTAGVGQGNTVTVIDPVTATFGTSMPVGSEPGQLAITDDESSMFVGVNGAGSFRRVDLVNSTLGPLVSLGSGFNGAYTAFDLDAMPGSSTTVAVTRSGGGTVSVYDGSVQRPLVGSSGTFMDFAAADTLVANNNVNHLAKYSVGASGLTQVGTMNALMSGEMEIKNGRIYGSNGRVVDTSLAAVAGTYFGLGYENAVAVDVPNGRVFFVTNNSGYSIRAYDMNTFRLIGSIPLPGLGQAPRKLIRWGTNGLAFRTDFNRVFLIQSSLVDGGEAVPTPSPTPVITPTPSPTQAATFVRRVNLQTNDLVYNSGTNSVIATVPGAAGAPVGNTMTHINPSTGEIVASTFIGSEPTRIAASDDGQTLYTTLNGANAIRTYNLVTRTPGTQFTPPNAFLNGYDMAVMPGNPGTLAIAGHTNGVALFDNGVQRPNTSNGGAYAINSLAFSSNPNILYGYDNYSSGFELVRFTASPTGVTGTTIANSLISGYGVNIKHQDGLLYATSGRVANPDSLALAGTFQGGGTAMAIDQAGNRIYFLAGNVLSAFDMQTYVKIGQVTIPGYSGNPTSLARWGTNGLVFRATTSSSGTDSQIYLIQSAIVSTADPIPTGVSMNATLATTFESSFTVSVTVTRTGETSTTAAVDYATADGTATAGQDYTARSGNLVFAPGETTKSFTVPIINDNIYEGTENFVVNLSNATGSNVFLVSPSSTTVNLFDNDSRPSVSNASTTILEPHLGTTTGANVQVTLTNPSVETITVNYSTAGGTATSGADFVAGNGVVTFAPLETVKSIPVQILSDTATEPNEMFSVNLSNPVNTTINSGLATVTIQNLNHAAHVFDFDGDAKTDIGIFRPSAGEWWIQRSAGTVLTTPFGATTDKIVPADYTGDGKSDVAFWRPETGEWYVLRSEDFSYFSFPFGATGDIPTPGDYDKDGKADTAVFRPSTATWYIRHASDGGTVIQQFGADGDIPVQGDYDGDGKTDLAIFRPSNGQWWLSRSTSGTIATTFGEATDKPVQGDYTGDGKTDVAFWRPATGEWFVLRSENFSFYSFPFGSATDIPAPGDYDGDGKFDATVFRPSNATWYSQRTTAGTLIQQFGATGDRPVPSAFVP